MTDQPALDTLLNAAGLPAVYPEADVDGPDLAPFCLGETALNGVPRPQAPAPEPVLCPWFRIDDRIIKTIGIAARFDSTAEITLTSAASTSPTPSTTPPTSSSET